LGVEKMQVRQLRRTGGVPGILWHWSRYEHMLQGKLSGSSLILSGGVAAKMIRSARFSC
jgi:hypothetical protein